MNVLEEKFWTDILKNMGLLEYFLISDKLIRLNLADVSQLCYSVVQTTLPLNLHKSACPTVEGDARGVPPRPPRQYLDVARPPGVSPGASTQRTDKEIMSLSTYTNVLYFCKFLIL